jgi:hypothetical protein
MVHVHTRANKSLNYVNPMGKEMPLKISDNRDGGVWWE